MEVIRISEFKKNLPKYLDGINDNLEVVVVSRSKGKSVVVMSQKEYNSINETLHVISSKANMKRLDEAITEMEEEKFINHQLLERD